MPMNIRALPGWFGRPQRFSGSLGIDVRLVDASLRQAGIAPSLARSIGTARRTIVDFGLRAPARAGALSSSVKAAIIPLFGLLQGPNNVGLLKRLAKQDPDDGRGPMPERGRRYCVDCRQPA